MESALAAVVGIGLAASCGFRVFLPMLVVSTAANAGYLNLAEGFNWIGTWTALAAFAVAAVVEITAYYIPWLDNLLDTIASPIAVVAGVVLFAANAEFDPFLRWSLAIIAGGGSAAIVQGGTVVTRAASTSTTGGIANFAVSTLETLAGLFFSVMSIVVPLLALVLLLSAIGGMYFVGRRVLRKSFPWGAKASR